MAILINLIEEMQGYTGKPKRVVEIDGNDYEIYDPPTVYFQWSNVLCHEECYAPGLDEIPIGQVIKQKSVAEYFLSL